MWYIASKLTGSAAYPTGSKLVNDPTIDASRFAYWVIANDEYKITLPLYIYLPKDPSSCEKIIFSVHGRNRNANKYRNVFVKHVQDKNVFLIAPEFRQGIFSSSLALTIGNMRRSLLKGSWLPPELWTFNILEAIFKLVSEEYKSIEKYSIFGHSAGAQFAYRLALFTDHSAIDTVVAANPGWFTILDFGMDFPYGIRGHINEEKLKPILSKNIILLAGDKDIEVDAHVRASKEAMLQGVNRFERAKYAFNKAKGIADKLETVFHWKLVVVKDLGHSSKNAAPVAIEYLL